MKIQNTNQISFNGGHLPVTSSPKLKAVLAEMERIAKTSALAGEIPNYVAKARGVQSSVGRNGLPTGPMVTRK